MKKLKQDAEELLLAHSQAKIEFYRRYLSRYLKILRQAQSIKQINIYEMYFAEWEYTAAGKEALQPRLKRLKRLFQNIKQVQNIIDNKR
ncbi:MAG: hypothetical protein LBT81_03230 [Helicobacteraceae bacterium]|jgi:hypothetical protein|nr:hypothetical protein [Helicobacteraceae bacterium]